MVIAEDMKAYSQEIVESLELTEEKGWNENVQDVLVVLSASRSGSTLVFNALSTSPNVIAPAGEHEPWLLLSGNKFPFTESDYVEELADEELLLLLLRNDLLVRTEEVGSREYLSLVANRMLIRGQKLPEDIKLEILGGTSVDTVVHQYLQRRKYGIDQLPVAPLNRDQLFDGEHVYPVENPPYIDIPLARLATTDELAAKTLLFKSPSDAYRAGVYEQLFPNANVRYIHLTRGYAQTVNGIMDGWLAGDDAFISNGVGLTGADLSITGYTHDEQTASYWCFDLFPRWQEFRGADLLTIGALQWIGAHRAILDDYRSARRIQFEGLYRDRSAFVEELEEATDCKIDPSVWEVPVMATHAPRQSRWRGREAIFKHMAELVSVDVYDEIRGLNRELGYSEDPATWL